MPSILQWRPDLELRRTLGFDMDLDLPPIGSNGFY
jgi:hypothetical protein